MPRILIVDDIESNLMILESRLKQLFNDVDIVYADDGSTAIDIYIDAHQNGRAFEYIITDSNMPILSGPGLAQRIYEYDREQGLSSIVFPCTTEDSKNKCSEGGVLKSLEECWAEGWMPAYARLSKPISPVKPDFSDVTSLELKALFPGLALKAYPPIAKSVTPEKIADTAKLGILKKPKPGILKKATYASSSSYSSSFGFDSPFEKKNIPSNSGSDSDRGTHLHPPRRIKK